MDEKTFNDLTIRFIEAIDRAETAITSAWNFARVGLPVPEAEKKLALVTVADARKVLDEFEQWLVAYSGAPTDREKLTALATQCGYTVETEDGVLKLSPVNHGFNSMEYTATEAGVRAALSYMKRHVVGIILANDDTQEGEENEQ